MKRLSTIFVILFTITSSSVIFAAPADIEEEYIPIPVIDKRTKKSLPKTYHIKIKAVDSTGKPLSRYMGHISIENADNLKFLKLLHGDIKLNANGTTRIPFNVMRPTEADWDYIEEVPMEVTFVVEILKKGSLTKYIKTIKKTFKLGMFLIHGRTVGPTKKNIFAFEPRDDGAAPIINDISYFNLYQLSSTTSVKPGGNDSRKGEFYILARIPPKYRAAGLNVRKPWHLFWDKSSYAKVSSPMRAISVPGDRSKDTIYDHLTVREFIGRTVELGDIDILSEKEHYKRIRAYMKDFIRQMPLKGKYRTNLLNDVDTMKIIFSTNTVPNYTAPALFSYSFSGTMSLPSNTTIYPDTYLAANPLGMFSDEDPAYMTIFHELGHLLHTRLIESSLSSHVSGFYKTLKGFTSDHKTWSPPNAIYKPKYFTTDLGQQYVSFNEATADFFAYLFFNFMDTKHPEFKNSIYYYKKYLNEFDNNEKSDKVLSRGGCIIEGVQTTYLKALYSANLKQSPTTVFADYLRTMMLNVTEKPSHLPYKVDSKNLNVKMFPTRTMKDWVLTKKHKKGIISVGDTMNLAKRYNIMPCNKGLEIFAFQGGTVKTSIKINGAPAPVDPTLGVIVGMGERITVTGGLLVINIQDSARAETKTIYAPEGAEFTLTAHDEIEVHIGAVGISGNIKIKPAGTKNLITPTGTVIFVEVRKDGNTKMQVLEGSASISTPEGKANVNEGKAVSIERGGRVTPAEPDKMTSVETFDDMFDVSGTSSEKQEEKAPSGKPAVDYETALLDIFHPASTVLKGAWANITSLKDSDNFKKHDWSKFKSGLVIENGLFATPGSGGQTEAIYYHDGSELYLKGHAAVLDCIDYCGRSGSIVFVIKGDDNNILWESGLLKQGSPGQDFSVSLEGVKELRLISNDGGNGIDEDWGIWANLSLTKTEKTPPPAMLITSDDMTQESNLPGLEGSISIITYSDSDDGLRVFNEFTTETDKIFLKTSFTGLTSDLFVRFKVNDTGRRVDILVIPVFISQGNSTRVLEIKRPLSGWAPGRYGVVALDGDSKVLYKITFVIINT